MEEDDDEEGDLNEDPLNDGEESQTFGGSDDGERNEMIFDPGMLHRYFKLY